MPKDHDRLQERVADWTAPLMFCCSLLFLIIIAVVLVLWVNIPMFLTSETEGLLGPDAVEAPQREVRSWISVQSAIDTGRSFLLVLLILWPLFIVEYLYHCVTRDREVPFWRSRYAGLLICLCPPLRLCARNSDKGGRIWFPWLGWREPNDELREKLERTFSVPMILIALTILPVLLIEVGMTQQVMTRPWLQFLLHFSTGVIWFAFAAEFIVMVSVAEKKVRYCKQHWLDIAIILLPIISFLRSLRVVRAFRLARLAKIQQLSKMGRLYRLRGLAMKALHSLMILELLNRLFRIGPEKQLRRLREVLEEKEAEVKGLRLRIAELEAEVARQQRQHPTSHATERVEQEV